MKKIIRNIKMTVSQMGMKLEYDSDHPEKTSPMIASQTKDIQNSIKKPATVTYDALGNLAGDSISLDMNQLSGAIIQLPEEEVNVGSQWNFDKSATVSGIDITSSMTYTVTSISKKSVDVKITGTVNSAEISGTYDGTASINPQTGMVMNSNMRQNLSMTINEQGMSIPVTIVGNTTVEVK